MPYTKQEWIDNVTVITAEKMQHIEDGIANEQAGPAGPQGEQGPKGDAGEQGPKGDHGEGLTGTAVTIEALAIDADAAAVLAKVNEVIAQLQTRGVTA